MHTLHTEGLFASTSHLDGGKVVCQSTLNPLAAAGTAAWTELRALVTTLLSKETATLRDNAELKAKALVATDTATMHLPATIGDYTDFCT
jgi:fumarylacetoacetase